MDTQRICAEIDLDAIEYNFDAARKKIPANVKLLAVIKADGYGHGAVPIAKLLKDKADYFAVATVDEGIELRKFGIKTPILVLGYFSPDYFEEAIEYKIQPVIFTEECAVKYSEAAVKKGVSAEYQIAVDTGMSRIGFAANKKSADIILKISKLPNIKITGLFSHFAAADEKDKTYTISQRRKFDSFTEMLKSRNIEIPLLHINNSAGIIESDEHYDMVREGIILYGLYPSEEVSKEKLHIKPAMSLISHISNIQHLPEGTGISYGITFITQKETTVATVPAGYADGYPRSLSNKGRVLIHGQYCKILGRVCMDQFMVDITDIPDVKIGDKVTLVGTDSGKTISVEDVADKANSFNYEFVCGISPRVPRVYYRNGEKIYEMSYLDMACKGI